MLRCVGIDLAWGERARTGVAVLDPEGRLVRSASVRTDDEIADVLGTDAQTPGLVVAIDAPLIVPNESGQRPCEREITRLFGRFHAGAYPANRGRPAFHPEPRAARLAQRFDWIIDPAVRPGPAHSVAIEVYPHSAMVSLFHLERVLPYKGKRGRTVASRRVAFGSVLDGIEAECGALLRLSESTRWSELRHQVATATSPVDLDRAEDEVDGILCAYVAWLWAYRPSSLIVVGDAAAGYIVTPPPPTSAS